MNQKIRNLFEYHDRFKNFGRKLCCCIFLKHNLYIKIVIINDQNKSINSDYLIIHDEKNYKLN